MTEKPEKKIQANILEFLKKLPSDHGFFFKVPQFMLSKAGISDIIGIYRPNKKEVGQFVAIEVKTIDGKATKLQLFFIRMVEKAGGLAGIARSVDDVKVLLKIS